MDWTLKLLFLSKGPNYPPKQEAIKQQWSSSFPSVCKARLQSDWNWEMAQHLSDPKSWLRAKLGVWLGFFFSLMKAALLWPVQSCLSLVQLHGSHRAREERRGGKGSRDGLRAGKALNDNIGWITEQLSSLGQSCTGKGSRSNGEEPRIPPSKELREEFWYFQIYWNSHINLNKASYNLTCSSQKSFLKLAVSITVSLGNTLWH